VTDAGASKKKSPLTDEQRADQALLQRFLAGRGWQILSVEDGFIRWKTSAAEGAVRLTDSGIWQLLADPVGQWDRCANALVRLTVSRFRAAALESLFERMKVAVAQFPKKPSGAARLS
jgi:hypothetical protein